MKKKTLAIVVALLALGAPRPASAQEATGTAEAEILKTINSRLPGTTGFGAIKVDSIRTDRGRTAVYCNTAMSYLPLDQAEAAALKADIASILGVKASRLDVLTTGRDIEELALFASKRPRGPREKDAFVTRLDAEAAPAGLDGANIAMWQSHGWYFEPKLNRWEWQRARLFQTVEDLYTQGYVMPFLMPMLENAGAYVMSPRERDTQLNEIISDNDAEGDLVLKGKWQQAPGSGFAYNYNSGPLHVGDNPFRAGTAMMSSDPNARAEWMAEIPDEGTYAVYVGYTTQPKSSKRAVYTIKTAAGDRRVAVNQSMGGGTWVYLGHFPFKEGRDQLLVELVNEGAKGSVITADAIKIGGGMGNVARIVKDGTEGTDYQYVTSGYPRFVEAARYFLQWAGAPDSVYTPSDNVNDYTDDYRSRGLWVNWLAGGSSMLPKREGLGVPVDLSFAFHTDAGTTPDDSIIGTLGIYSTADKTLGNGGDRLASRDFTTLVMNNIVRDVRAKHEPEWTRRGMWDQRYFEARVPEVPAMLLEFLSHQNFADMKYGLDPEFRFDVSRAIYKGMLQFLAHRDGRAYVVQPLPVGAFAIRSAGGDTYRLTWRATTDSLEATAMPSYYLVQQRDGASGGAFRTIARVEQPEYVYTATDDAIHSFRIIAGNDGGVSFPSEVLAMRHAPGVPVVIVNGFTRISAPDWFDSGEIAGFYDARDHGVPYVQDISFIGSQFEFRRDIPWMDDDAAGFGASRANYEDRVVAGNTFDFVALHGEAIAATGRGFVSESVESFCTAPVVAGSTVDLILGKQKEIAKGRGVYGSRYKAFPEGLQQALRAHTAAGGNVFVSGAYVATDIWDNPFSSKEVAEADKRFATEVLGYQWRVGQATVEGYVYGVPSPFKAFSGGEWLFNNTLDEECYAVESPDSFFAPDKEHGFTIMRYSENNLVAGIAFAPGSYRTVVIGFPFETILGEQSRVELMRQVLDFFNSAKK